MTDYSDADYGVKGMFNIVSKELHYEGFVYVEISLFELHSDSALL